MSPKGHSHTIDVLHLVARLHPSIWDVINPHGPAVQQIADRVTLNPQPLPPGPDPFVLAAARMANEFAGLAVAADIRRESPKEWVAEFVDDWCGTPWPSKWPWPWPSPRPDHDTAVDPDTVSQARLVGAIIFASLGSRLGDRDLSATFLDGAEQLVEAAVRTQG
jgi:hypothetical protein